MSCLEQFFFNLERRRNFKNLDFRYYRYFVIGDHVTPPLSVADGGFVYFSNSVHGVSLAVCRRLSPHPRRCALLDAMFTLVIPVFRDAAARWYALTVETVAPTNSRTRIFQSEMQKTASRALCVYCINKKTQCETFPVKNLSLAVT